MMSRGPSHDDRGDRGDRANPDAEGVGVQTDRSFFLAVEKLFLEHRGAPLLLSPEDWRVSRGWRQRGIPLDLILKVIEEVFTERRKKERKRRISSLRYFDRAVRDRWAEARELLATGERRREAEEFVAAPRLAALANALPSELPGRGALVDRLQGLADEFEDPAAVEGALSALDVEVLGSLEATLDDHERQALDREVGVALEALAARLDSAQLEDGRQRLRQERLRRHFRLPVLSLFAPEAELPNSEERPSADTA